MATTEKIAAVAEMVEQFNSSSAAVITEYRGLTVKQVTELRRALGADTTYAVVKNTLTKRAAADAGVTIDDSLLTGPTAIAFVGGDPVLAAKGLRDFAKANPLLVIKGGLLDGKTLSADEVSKIADLESARFCWPSWLAPSRRCRPVRLGSSRPRCRRWPVWLPRWRRKKPAGDAPVAAVADDNTTAVADDAPAAVADDAPAVADDAATETPAEPAE